MAYFVVAAANGTLLYLETYSLEMLTDGIT